jgi:hypothetical protein
MQNFRDQWRPKDIELVGCDDDLTDTAGMGTVIRLFDQSPMAAEFAKCLPERNSVRSMGAYRLALAQIASLIHDDDSLEDIEDLREDDPYIAEYFGGSLPAARTMGDFLRSFEGEHLEKLQTFLGYMGDHIRGHMQEVLSDEFKPAENKHISIDSTSHVQHGELIEGVAWNYKDEWCLDSQVLFCEMGLCRGFELRSGNTKSGTNAANQIYRAFQYKKQARKTHLSGDSAYCFQEVIRAAMDLELTFTFTANDAYTDWQSHIDEITNWEPWVYTFEEAEKARVRFKRLPYVEVGSFNWFPSWAEGKLCFPIIVKRTRIEPGEHEKDQTTFFGPPPKEEPRPWKYYGIVTNRSLLRETPREIIELHNKRGNSENFIKEGKYGFDLKHFPCLAMNANFAYGLLAQIAHNLVRWVAVIEKPDKPHFAKKIRKKFVFKAGRMVRHARKVVLKVRHKFKQEVDRLKRAWQPLPLQVARAGP